MVELMDNMTDLHGNARRPLYRPFGYAKGTTGGGYPHKVVYPASTRYLIGYLESNEALVIILDPVTDYNLDGRTVMVKSNKTVIGQNRSTIKRGEFRIQKQNNVIVYNVRFRDTKGDGITIRASTMVYIQSCTFDNWGDGAVDCVDAREGGMDVTVAFCKFLRGHKTHLIGWSPHPYDNKIRLTLYRNYYQNVGRRVPQVNQGWVHMRNCYIKYEDQCVGCYEKGRVWVDRCFIVSNKKKSPCAEYKSSSTWKAKGYGGFSGCLYKDTKHLDREKSKAKAAKCCWEDMPRLSKSWSSAKKIKAQAGSENRK